MSLALDAAANRLALAKARTLRVSSLVRKDAQSLRPAVVGPFCELERQAPMITRNSDSNKSLNLPRYGLVVPREGPQFRQTYFVGAGVFSPD